MPSIFLIAALKGGECSASSPSYFTPGVRATGTRRMGGWVSASALRYEKVGPSYNTVPVFIHRWEYQLSSQLPWGTSTTVDRDGQIRKLHNYQK